MVKRYELTEAQWHRIAGLLPGKVGDPGRTARKWRSVGAALGRALARPAGAIRQVEERPHPLRSLGQERRVGACFRGSHQRSQERVPHAGHYSGSRPPAGCDRKRGDQNHALGRARGGLTSKIHMLADALGRPLRFILTGGQVHDVITAPALLDGVEGGGVIADKAYDSNSLRQLIADAGMVAVIPSTRSRKV